MSRAGRDPYCGWFKTWCWDRYWDQCFFKTKTRDNVYSILTQGGVYRNVTNVNDELLELLLAPADEDGAQVSSRTA
jgi:hypothetical protein